MAGELMDAVRSRYQPRLSRDGEDFPEGVLRIDGFVHDVLERWEEAGEWVATHLATFRRPADEESERREAGSKAKPPFLRRGEPRAVEPPEGNGRRSSRKGVAELPPVRARARRHGDPAGGTGRVSRDEWSLIERFLGPLGSGTTDVPSGGGRLPPGDFVQAPGVFRDTRAPGAGGGSPPACRPEPPASLPGRERELAAGASVADVLRRLRAEREWESRGF